MKTLLLTKTQIIFIAVLLLVVLVVAFAFSYYFINKKVNQKHFKEHYYKTIYDIAMKQDYYLINNYKFKTGEKRFGKIDHILFADKYIYLILDCYHNGDLTGSIQDPSLVLIDKTGKKQYVKNRVVEVKTILEKLTISTELDPELFVGIVLVNDDVNLDIKPNNQDFYYIQRRKIAKLVKTIEDRDVKDLNKDELARVVHIFDLDNRSNK